MRLLTWVFTVLLAFLKGFLIISAISMGVWCLTWFVSHYLGYVLIAGFIVLCYGLGREW